MNDTTSSLSSPAQRSSRTKKAIPPARWKALTSSSPLGYIRTSKGIAADRRWKSSQRKSMPAQRAMATRCRQWLVDPPVASNPAMALTREASVNTW